MCMLQRSRVMEHQYTLRSETFEKELGHQFDNFEDRLLSLSIRQSAQVQ
ncbi:MAG: hypothetical protein ACI9Y1_001097 [Lentisphaeria bacterium]|jgi:hypothetical protein